MQYLLKAVCHKDVRAVKDSAIVLSADKVETLDAEPTALVPEKIWKIGCQDFAAKTNVISVLTGFSHFKMRTSHHPLTKLLTTFSTNSYLFYYIIQVTLNSFDVIH